MSAIDLEEIKGLMERARHRPGAPGWHLHDSHFFSWLADQGVSHETIAYMKAAKSVLPTLIKQHERMREALERVITKWERGENHNEGAFDPDCETCLILADLRSALNQQEETNGYRS